MNGHRFTSAADAKSFALAGNSTITLKSQRSGHHLTFKIRKPSTKDVHFVRVLRGSNLDDRSQYEFLGTIRPDGSYAHGYNSVVPPMHPARKAFPWFWEAMRRAILPTELEVWHEGRCGRCGRKLTHPESIAAGIGPECAGKVRHLT